MDLEPSAEYVIAPPAPEPSVVNRQLWENSPIRESSVAEDVKSDTAQLFNSREPDFGIQHEKAEHRIVILLKAQGHSNLEIARLTGYTNPWVGQILRQPWAKQRLLEEINSAGRDSISGLLEGAAADSIYKIVELRDTAEDQGVQLRSAQDILDRFLGKATQKIESKAEVKHISGDIEEVDKALERLAAEESRLLGKTTSATLPGNGGVTPETAPLVQSKD